MKITTVLSASSNNPVCLERMGGAIECWEGRLGGLPVRLLFDDDFQEPDKPTMYSLHVYFDHPVTTYTNAGSPIEDIDGDEIRYFLLRDLAGDGAPTGIVAGMPARAVRLESGWLLTVWAEDAADVRLTFSSIAEVPFKARTRQPAYGADGEPFVACKAERDTYIAIKTTTGGSSSAPTTAPATLAEHGEAMAEAKLHEAVLGYPPNW